MAVGQFGKTLVNQNLAISHLCNLDDIYFRLVSAAIYDIRARGLKYAPNQLLCIIDKLCKEFRSSFSFSLSTYQDLCVDGTYLLYPSLLAEIIDCLAIDQLSKISLLLDTIRIGAGTRAISYYSFYIKFTAYGVSSRLPHIDPFRVIIPENDLISSYYSRSSRVSISPYNFMSFGHYAWPLMALNQLLAGKISRLILWANPSYLPDGGELISILKSKRLEGISYMLPMETALENPAWIGAYESSHNFHMKHNRSNLLCYQEDAARLRNIIFPNNHMIETSTMENLIYHVRDNSFKLDRHSSEAATRNSTEKFLLDALVESFSHYNLISWNAYRGSSLGQTGRGQWAKIISADLFVVSMSGLSLMCQFNPTATIFHNSTNLCLGYDIPARHLFIPKRIGPLNQESSDIVAALDRKKLLFWLMGDWSFNPHFSMLFSINEVSTEVLVKEFTHFKRHEYVNIITWYLDKANMYGCATKDITFDHPPRYVSKHTLLMFESLLER